MPLATIAFAAASFACAQPWHHDGDNIRCAGIDRSMRLYGIDAPEMPGACRPGRRCTPGDPYAARDELRALTDGRRVSCVQRDTDSYGRPVVQCEADGVDLSCAMIASGHAVPRYGALDCGGVAAQAAADTASESGAAPTGEVERFPPGRTEAAPAPTAPVERRFIPPSAAGPDAAASGVGVWPWLVLAWLLAINPITWLAFARDKKAARQISFRPNRIPEARLLGLAAAGGSPAAWAAMRQLRHKTRKQPFRTWLLVITGLQMGALLGLALLAAGA